MRIKTVEQLKKLKKILAEYNNEKAKINQSQERLDNLEILLTQIQTQIKSTQIQSQINDIEQILSTEYANEKTKIKQNQDRLDNLEKLFVIIQERLGNQEILSTQNKRDLDIIFLRSARNENSKIKRFNFLEKETNSQSGEDAILAYVVSRLGIPLEDCTYLDLGANRPIEGSNTNFFYTMGARGVLVEANPELIPALLKERPEDIVLNRCLDTEDGKQMEFIIMTDDGLSTPDETSAAEVLKVNPNIQIKSRVSVQSITINQIFKDYFPKPPVICSIDIEGQDLEILKSVDFSNYRPLLIVSEMIRYSNQIAINDKRKDILEYMDSVGYKEYAFTGINSIFIDYQALKEKWNY